MFRQVGPLAAFRFYMCQFVKSITTTPQRRRLEEFGEQWGKGGSKDSWLTSRYFELIATGRNQSTYVDDRTWNDLEFPCIFTDIDTTVTRLGSQYLYSQLRTYRCTGETRLMPLKFFAVNPDRLTTESLK